MLNVYAPQALNEKVNLWTKLLAFMNSHVGDYIMFGDFIAVRMEEDRFGSEFNQADTNAFDEFLIESSLVEMYLGGNKYTWRNKAGNKMSKLDPFFVTNNILDSIEHLKGVVLPRGFDDIVKETWVNYVPDGRDLSIMAKLKNLKAKLKIWNKEIYSSDASRIQQIVLRIVTLDSKMDDGSITELEIKE
ncbi:uncharacterized protein [Rutidosis leptorrhynchoides]|uniref:uncharacterized protein n=1 Tax=Rutidosis leptorrhynchoides TaxID=125765 RepID=UPI003A99F26C